MCASHGGEPRHVQTRRGMLRKVGGFRVSDLLCGAHAPMHEPSARELVRRGERADRPPQQLFGQARRACCWPAVCSELPSQRLHRSRAIRCSEASGRLLARYADIPESAITVAVDGCNLPVFRLPLRALACAYARLIGSRAERRGPRRRRRCGRASSGRWSSRPLMVAGSGRFTTDFLRAGGGRWIGKEGAEGVYAVGLAPAPRREAGRGRRVQDRGRLGAGPGTPSRSRCWRGSAGCRRPRAGPSRSTRSRCVHNARGVERRPDRGRGADRAGRAGAPEIEGDRGAWPTATFRPSSRSSERTASSSASASGSRRASKSRRSPTGACQGGRAGPALRERRGLVVSRRHQSLRHRAGGCSWRSTSRPGRNGTRVSSSFSIRSRPRGSSSKLRAIPRVDGARRGLPEDRPRRPVPGGRRDRRRGRSRRACPS